MSASTAPPDPRFEALVQAGAEPDVVAAMSALVRDGTESELVRVDPLAVAARTGLDEDRVIDGFVHAAKLGLFEMSWNMICAGCGGVLDANTALTGLQRASYPCSLCATDFEPTLDDRVEVTFTVSPGLRRVGAHDPDSLSLPDYYRQQYFSSGMALPRDEQWKQIAASIFVEAEEVPARGRVILSMRVADPILVLFDAVTHGTVVLEVAGEPVTERQEVRVAFNDGGATPAKIALRPGPLRLALENGTNRRILPVVMVADERLGELFGRRREYLTAKRVLSNQAFRDLYRTDTLGIDQRLKVTSLTVLFTDLKGSTELYERVGDLAAYDLVRTHFKVLGDAVRTEGGAVVKTIGDAVMATFPTPEGGLAAALLMREAMARFNARQAREDLVVKIGLHEGPCLAVMSNERLDYFGQTVNIAARVQGLATSQAIFVTEPVVQNGRVAALLDAARLVPLPQRALLRGIRDEVTVYEIP